MINSRIVLCRDIQPLHSWERENERGKGFLVVIIMEKIIPRSEYNCYI